MTKQISDILEACWKSGGHTFGGTSRDLIRGETPTDLDLKWNSSAVPEAFGRVEKVETGMADQGPEYYDQRVIYASGLQVDLKRGFVCVTDCDINLLKVFKDRITLLYVPDCYRSIGEVGALLQILTNIGKKQFIALDHECEPHRRYRWKKFIDRGWTCLNPKALELAVPCDPTIVDPIAF